MYPHRIRLRGPWECEPLERAAAQAALPMPPACRMTLPCCWGEAGLGDFAGRVRFRRRFGYPGQIDSWERVWLTFSGVADAAAVHLNGVGMGEGQGDFEFDATALLQQRNEVVVEVSADGGHGGLTGETALEIRCTAYLRGVHSWTEPEESGCRLHVEGELVGECDRALDLYVLIDGTTHIYTTLNPIPQGRRFHLRSELLPGDAPCGGVRIELINGAVVWYALEPK